MKKLETRRINPISRIVFFAVVILVVFEGLIMFGTLEVKAITMAKYAPWAYEPFLRLVGEHPESAPRWANVEEPQDSAAEPDTIKATGLTASAIPLLQEATLALLETNVVLEATVPLDAVPEPIPVLIPTNTPKPEQVIPVG